MQSKNLNRSIRTIFRLCRIGRRFGTIPDTGNRTAICLFMAVVGMSIMDSGSLSVIP
jgi:hypothetical protein